MMTQRNETFSRLTRGLSLAAAPAFAAMAVLSALPGEGSLLCVSQSGPMSGMTMMYALMSVFHFTPWVTWIAAHVPSESRQTCHSRASVGRE